MNLLRLSCSELCRNLPQHFVQTVSSLRAQLHLRVVAAGIVGTPHRKALNFKSSSCVISSRDSMSRSSGVVASRRHNRRAQKLAEKRRPRAPMVDFR